MPNILENPLNPCHPFLYPVTGVTGYYLSSLRDLSQMKYRLIALIQKKESRLKTQDSKLKTLFSDPAGIRTRDPRLKRPLLYRLSYRIKI